MIARMRRWFHRDKKPSAAPNPSTFISAMRDARRFGVEQKQASAKETRRAQERNIIAREILRGYSHQNTGESP